MQNCLKWMMVALGRLCLFVTTFFFSFSLGLGTTYPSTFWILPLSSSILFTMIFVISAIYKRCASNQKNEETRTPIDERTRLNDDDDENENERTNETRSKRTQVMKEEDPPIYMLASPALLCFASPLYLLGIDFTCAALLSLLLASLPCNVDTLLAWEEKGTPISFFFNNAKWKS
jgi:hypothetical protein